MKKIVLILSLFFASVNFVNASNGGGKLLSPQKIEKMDPDFCWSFADAVSTADCGSPTCDIDFWYYAYDNCMAV